MVPLKEHPPWKILFEKYKDINYGDLITHETIESDLGMKRGNQYYHWTNRWCKEMLEKMGKQIECDPKRGYRAIMPSDYRHSTVNQMKKAKRRIRRAGIIISNTPYDKLSDDERSKHMFTAAGLKQLSHFMGSTVRKIIKIDKKPDQLSLNVGRAFEVADRR